MALALNDNPLRRKLAIRNAAAVELEACPFCGGQGEMAFACAWGGLPANHHVACIECGARTPPFFTEVWTGADHVTQDAAALAAERWNARSDPRPPRPRMPRYRTGLAPRKDD